jgi:hypothetical protein
MKFIALSLAALVAGLSIASADSIKLKNGETIADCTITAENPDSYEIEVDLGNGIKDFRTIKKAEVEKLTRTSPDEKEAAALKSKLDPSRDGMTAQEYEKAIREEIQPWLDKHKKSAKRAEIEALLKLYNEELAKARAGEIKLRGTWITVEEKKWNAYNVEARKLRIKIENLIKEKKYVEAYSAFAEMELTGAAGVDFPPVVEAIKKILPNLEGAIKNALAEAPAKIKQRTAYVAGLQAEQKKNEELRIKKERADWTAKVALERKNKVRIPSYDPFDLKSIQDSLAAVQKEAAVLGALDLPAMAAANKKFEQGLKDLHSRAFLSAKANFEAAAKVHSKDAAVKKYIDEATKAATAPPAGTKPK